MFFGLFVLGAGAYGIYMLGTIWAWNWSWTLLLKVPGAILVLVCSLVAIDSGLGMVEKRDRPVELYTIADHDPRQTLVIPGFNGVGPQLVDVLAINVQDESLHGLVTFHPPYHGYDEQVIADALYQWWLEKQNRLERFDVYAESQGLLVVLRMLRQHPDVRIDTLIANAGVTSSADVLAPKALLGALGTLSGGPISTGLVRLKQAQDVRNSPKLTPGTNPQTARAAQQASRNTTAPMLLGQLKAIADSEPLLPSSLNRRVGKVTYLRASSTKDAFVNLDSAVKSLRAAVGEDTPFTETVVPEFGETMHTPTPERPQAAIEAIATAAN